MKAAISPTPLHIKYNCGKSDKARWERPQRVYYYSQLDQIDMNKAVITDLMAKTVESSFLEKNSFARTQVIGCTWSLSSAKHSFTTIHIKQCVWFLNDGWMDWE